MERLNILYGEADSKSLTALAQTFTAARHQVMTAVGRDNVLAHAGAGNFDVIVLGHSLTRDDRHHLPYMIRKAQPHAAILVLHASGHHPQVDMVMDSRCGEAVVLAAVEKLARRMVAA